MALKYTREFKLPWPLLVDHDRKVYSRFNMSRGNWWSIYNPVSIIKYLRLIFSGQRPGKPGKDWRQLGGDVLIDPGGSIRLHHVSTTPHDRPDAESILELVRTVN